MIKTLSKARKQERVKFRIPRSVQDCIPIRRIWADGIFQVGHQFLQDLVVHRHQLFHCRQRDKTAMFLTTATCSMHWTPVLSAKITLYNRRINKEEFERSVLLPLKQGWPGQLPGGIQRDAARQVAESNNSIVRERYLTISVVKRNIEEARTYFAASVPI